MHAPQPAVLLRIYTDEGKVNDHRPLYEDIVMKARAAKLAGPPSPPGPPPAAVVTIPLTASKRRTRELFKSTINTFPFASTAAENGALAIALVAAPPSPE